MKYSCLVVALLLALCLATPTLAQGGATVLCQGNICGGGGIRNYQYDVTGTGGLMIHQFHVGTCDPNIADYTNIIGPAGWSFGIANILEDHRDAFTPHGGFSAPDGRCLRCAVWTEPENGAGVQNALFGFDNPNHAHDVGWFLNSGLPVENWNAAVGMGAGPVHGPVPEPSSILALCSGLIALAGLKLRKRA